MRPLSVVRFSCVMLAMAALAGCTPPTASSYLNRGGPESLLDISSEVVTLPTSTNKDAQDLGAWIEKDRPSRAELRCNPADKPCKAAMDALDKKQIPVAMGAGDQPSVTLVYERILARDCNPSYIDNPNNFDNLNHPAFGCAVASNIVQHVTNKQEFINPAISDDPSAVRAVNDVRRAYTPRPVVVPYNVREALTNSARTGQ